MINLPTTIEEIDNLIRDQIQESLHLDYKDSRAIDNNRRAEIAKDVSAFANSDGGLIIYGVIEENRLPVRRDNGVDSTVYTREWVEQVIQSHINPRVEGLRIANIPVGEGRSIYAISIPKSYRGLHQASDKRYYKRFNFQSAPMEDYEINDIRSRRRVVSPLISVDIVPKDFIAILVVANIGTLPAYDVSFPLIEGLVWKYRKEAPSLLTQGTKVIQPRKTYEFFYDSFSNLLKDNESPPIYRIEVSYIHPEIDQRINEVFEIDIESYRHALITETELAKHSKVIKDAFRDLTREVRQIRHALESLSSIAGSTGLDFSVSTLRNLKYILAGEDHLEKIDPRTSSPQVFRDILGVDDRMASELWKFFHFSGEDKRLQDLQGMTEQLIEKIQKFFVIRDSQL